LTQGVSCVGTVPTPADSHYGKRDYRSGRIFQRQTRRPLRNPFSAARPFERGGPLG